MKLQQTEELTPAEVSALETHEETIEHGRQTFLDVGRALAAIQEGKLYRDTCPTFEDYCKARWGMSKSYAYRQIEAAAVVDEMSPIGDKFHSGLKVESEGQARELGKIEPEKREKVLKSATKKAKAEGKEKPTAKDIKAEVQKVKATPVKPEETPAKPIGPEPWNTRYHPAHDEAAAALDAFRAAIVKLARLDGTDAAFVAWIVEKDWCKSIDGMAATLAGHRVTGWASEAEKSRLSDSRPFLFKIDKAKGRRSA